MSEPTKTMTRPAWKKRVMVAAWLLFGYLVWKADVFWNYYQFRQLCAAEGGLKVNEKLQKNVGWEEVVRPELGGQPGEQAARSYLSRMPDISFFRVPKANDFPPPLIPPGTLVDVRFLGAPALPTTSYSFQVADLSIPVIYQIHRDAKDEQDNRVTRFWFEVRERETQSVRLRYTQFRFHWRTIPVWHWFGPAGTTGCPVPEGTGKGLKDIEQINGTAFKD